MKQNALSQTKKGGETRMLKKSLIRWLSLCLLIVTVVGVVAFGATKAEAAPTGYVLEDMVVVLPVGATDLERTAASELVAYLKKMTGKATSVVAEGTTVKKAIYVGATEFAADNGVTYTDNNGMGEGWAIKGVGDHLVITGGETRGVLYGVYHLLEDQLGIHWWNMWEEYVPEVDDAVVPFDIDVKGEPVFAERGIYSDETFDTLYYARNRMNGWTSNAPQEYGGELDFTRPYHVHIFNRYYPAFYSAPSSDSAAKWTDLMNPEGVDWFIAHPEWFAYSKARGERISYGQMCLTNEELVEDFTDKFIKAIALSYEEADEAGIDRPKYISVTPNDTGGLCECPDCEASTAVHGPSGHLLQFVNKIAAGIAEVYPEMTVETLAYWQYFEVPLDDTVPADNVVIRLASSDVNTMCDLDHPTNTQVKARLDAWSNILKPGQLWYWNYGVNYSENGVFPNLFNFGTDVQYVEQAGAFGVFYELQNINSSDFWDLKHWVLTKVLEDPYADIHELVKTFANGYYGEAAGQYIYEYLVKMDELVVDSKIAYDFMDKFIENPWLSAEDVKWAHGMFEEAIQKTEDADLTEEEKELFINRINVARGGLDRQILANYSRYVEEMAAKAGDDPDKLFGIGQKETGHRMVQALEWLCEMELTDDHTGLQNPGKRGDLGTNSLLSQYSMYAGEQDPVTGDYLDRPEIPQVVYDDHPGIDEAHIYDYTNSTFWNASVHFGFTWIGTAYDASYEGGSSVLLDHAENARQHGGAVSSAYTFSESKAFSASFSPKWYLGDPIQNDGEWHWYRAEDVTVLTEGNNMIRFWDEVMRFELTDMDHLVNDLVDVYVSMKVVGDPTGEDKNNLAKVYIDRLIIVEDCDAHNVNYTSSKPATCAKGEVKVGICPICGKKVESEVAGTKLPHTIVGDYTYDAVTNTYNAECSKCGEVEFQFQAELPANVLAALKEDGYGMERVYDFSFKNRDFTTFVDQGWDYHYAVEDSDSVFGEAVAWDLNLTPYLSYFTITDSKAMTISGAKVGQPLYAGDYITDGQYHAYRMKDVDLFAGGTGVVKFFEETLQLNVARFSHLKGKPVDMYVSMKIEGDLKFDVAGQMPKYYIDRIILVEKDKVYETKAELPQAIKDEIAAGNTTMDHIYDFTYDDFGNYIDYGWGWQFKANDPDAVGGEAILFDLNGCSSVSYVQTYFAITEDQGLVCSGAKIPNPIKAGDVITDGKYHIYKMEDVNAFAGNGMFYFFDWTLDLNVAGKTELQGVRVDMYLSMKVEGDLKFDALGAMPKYYIDRIILVDSCANHVIEGSMEVLSEATCTKGQVVRSTCSVCEVTSEVERKDTILPHSNGEVTFDTTLNKYKTVCSSCNQTITYDNVLAKLPEYVLADLEESGSSLGHVYDFRGMDSWTGLSAYAGNVTDADSAFGQAFTVHDGPNGGWNADYIYVNETTGMKLDYGKLGAIPAVDLVAKANKGYQIFKLNDIKIPEAGTSYATRVIFFDEFMNHDKMGSDINEYLLGKTVDIYVSLKIDGDPINGPVTFYFDRFIVADTCNQYDLKYDQTLEIDGQMVNVATCPICGEVKTQATCLPDGSTCVFTKYLQQQYEKDKYVAQCDNGCGNTDTKINPKLSVEQKVAELEAKGLLSVDPAHVLQSYSIGDFNLSGVDDGAQWDNQLGRPVGVRAYDPKLSASTQYALNLTTGLEAAMYKAGAPIESVGTFSGSEITANAGDGEYHLYSIKNVVPVKYESYNYMFLFTDWVMQVHMIDDDLLLAGYRNKAVDLYLYMKVDGDPSCSGPVKPTYYIDQLLVVSSCEPDSTWVTEKEATCAEAGLMRGTCSICGKDGATYATPKTAHTFDSYMVYQEPTCKTNKWEYGACTICGTRTEQEVPNSTLEHIFEDYIEQEDGVTEIAYCSRGCGERHIRTVGQSDSIEIPEKLEQMLPVIGNAAAGAAGAFNFSDVNVGDWFYDEVKLAWEYDLIDGINASEYRPNETLTRAQAIKLAAALNQMYFDGEVRLTNGAVNWYDSYVEYAIDNSIIDAKYADYSVSQMNAAITRSEFVAIFGGTLEDKCFTGWNSVADNAIPDVKMTDANAAVIYKFYRAGILTGSDGAGTFNPDSSIKRSEVAAILIRMFEEGSRQSVSLG